MKIIKNIDASFFVNSVFDFPLFPRCNNIAVSAFNIVIDNIVKLNDKVVDDLISARSQSQDLDSNIFERILEELKKEDDIEISISDRALMDSLMSFFREYLSERRFGGNAYHAYTILRHIFREAYIYTNGKYIRELKNISSEFLRNNIVLEYNKGLKIEEKELTEDSRLIISDRSMHVDTWMYGERSRDNLVEKCSFYFLSGYHHIKNENDIIRSKNSIVSLKGFKHIELSEFTRPSLKSRIVSNILRYVDSLGMNDIEAKDIFMEDPLSMESFSHKIVKIMSGKVIVFVHSRKYMIVYLPKRDSLRYKGVLDAFMFAQKIGLIKTLYDSYLENPIKFWELKYHNISYHILPIPLGYGLYETSYHFVYLVPTILVDVKQHVVGLGDVISTSFASYLFCENNDVLCKK